MSVGMKRDRRRIEGKLLTWSKLYFYCLVFDTSIVYTQYSREVGHVYQCSLGTNARSS